MNEPSDDKKPEAPPQGGLVHITQEQAQAQALQLAQVSEQMKDMNDRLTAVGDMLKNLPGTIGKAVADALLRPKNASGPAIPLVGGLSEEKVEFGKGQAMKVGGKVVTEGRALPEFRKPESKATRAQKKP
jgi:hypothetical protein